MIKKNILRRADFIFLIPFLILYFLSLKVAENRYLLFVTFMLWVCITILFYSKQLIASFNFKYVYIYFFIIYLILFSFNGDLISTLKFIGVIAINFSPIFFFDYFLKNNKSKEVLNRNFFIIINCILMYLIFATLYYLIQNPMIARYLTSYDPSNSNGIGNDLPKAIGGGYSLAYGVIFVPPVLVFFVKNSFFNIKSKILMIFVIVFLYYFILKMNFTIAFILSVVFSLLLLFSKGKKMKDIITIGLTAILITIFYITNKNSISNLINYLSNLFDQQSVIYLRLVQLAEFIAGKDGTTSVSYRVENINRSISTFFDHPIVGGSYLAGFNFRDEAVYIGQHSEWIDTFARYGLIGAIPLLVFLGLSFKDLYVFHKDTIAGSLYIYLITMVIALGFLNPFFNSTVLMILFIYIPSLIKVYNSWINKGVVKNESNSSSVHSNS